MRKLLLATTAALSLGATAAFAELTTQQIVDMFPGATSIHIHRGTATTEVEVVVGTDKIEVTFDNATDAEIKREVTALTGDGTMTGDDSGDNEDDSDDDSEDDDSDDGSDDESDDSHDDSNDEGDDD